MSSLPRLPELAREVAEIANGVVAASRAAGRDDLADLLVQAAGRWSAADTTVAVVGESGVGKTALVNALVGRAALPTRELTGRSTLAVVRPGATPAATATSRGAAISLDPDAGAIASWLEAQGPLSDGVSGIEVSVLDPATGPSLTLVDTPGVTAGGGRGRAVVTAHACDVLLFVTDADSPLTRPELELLAEARGAAGAVLVVLSRVDRFRGWTQVRDADRELLATELPGAQVDVLPVSSSLAAVAHGLRGRDDDGAAALEDESGVLAARRALAGLTGRTRELRLLGLLRLAEQIGAELDAERERIEATSRLDREQAAREAAVAQQEMETLRERAGAAGTALTDEAQRLRESLLVEVRRAGTAALAAREAAREGRRKGDEDAEAAALLDELDAAKQQLDASVAERLEALAEWLLRQVEGAADGASPVALPTPQAGPRAVKDKDRSLRLRFAAALISSGSGAILLGTMFMPEVGASALRPGLMSVGMLSGGMSAVVALRHSGLQRASSARKVAVKSLVDEWQAVTVSALRADVMAGQRRAEAALKQAVRELLEERGRQVADLQARAAGGTGSSAAGDDRALRAHLDRARELSTLLREAA